MPRTSDSTKKFIITWQIKNFTLSETEDKKCIRSKTVSAKSLGDTEWCLEIIFRKSIRTEKTYIDVALSRCFDYSNLNEIEVEFCFECIKANGYVFKITEYKRVIFTKDCITTTRLPFTFEKLVEMFRKLSEDVLIIRCTLLSKIKSEMSFSECIAWNEIGVEKYSYTLQVQIPSSPSWSQTEILTLDQFSHIKVIIIAPIQFLHIKLLELQGKLPPGKISCKLSMLGEVGREIYSKRYLESLVENIPCKLRRFIHKDWLRLEHGFVTNEKFPLRLEFFIPSGTMSEWVEYPSDLKELPSVLLPTNFENNLLSILKNRIMSDVCLTVNNERFFAHKCILASQSLQFRNMFMNSNTTVLTNVFLMDIDALTLKHFLNFLYTGKPFEWDGDIAINLLKAAINYNVPSLMGQCCSFLTTRLTDENVHEVHELAVQVNYDNLIKSTNNYIKRLRI